MHAMFGKLASEGQYVSRSLFRPSLAVIIDYFKMILRRPLKLLYRLQCYLSCSINTQSILFLLK